MTTWAGVCHACTILTVVRIGAVSITAKLAAVRGCRRAACFVFGERPCFRIQKKSGAFESSCAVSLPVFRCPTLRLIARVHCSQRLLGHDRYKLELDATLWSIHSIHPDRGLPCCQWQVENRARRPEGIAPAPACVHQASGCGRTLRKDDLCVVCETRLLLRCDVSLWVRV